jgi:nucleotide-binding universal stress UspA family protein
MTFAPKHILAPLAVDLDDDFQLSESAVDAACALAEKFGSEITLVYFASVPAPPKSTGSEASDKIYKTLAMVLEERVALGKKRLAEILKKAKARGVKVKSAVLDTEESIAHAICHLATQEGADLILIGTHARHGIKKLLLGSVAEHVVHIATVPVLLLRTN